MIILNAFREALKSARLVKKNLGWLAIACINDALFFVLYGFLSRGLREGIVAGITTTGAKLAQIAQETIKTPYLKLLLHESVKPYTLRVLGLLALLGIIIFALYCFFHGTNWWIARTIAGKNESYHAYLWIFAKLNILWMAMFIIYFALDTYFDLKSAMLKVVEQPASQPVLPIIFLTLTVYFALISYSKTSLRGVLKAGKNLKLTIPPIAICAALLAAIHFITKLLGMFSPTTALVTGLALALPALTFTRTHLARMLAGY